MKKSKKAVKIIIIIAAVIIILGLVYLADYLKSVNDYQNEVSSMTFEDIDIKSIPDGSYKGECNVNYLYAKVEVTVKDGKITDINLLEHRNDRGKAAEAVIDRIIDEQKVDVDTVSSATNSSKVLKKAVENALKSNTK